MTALVWDATGSRLFEAGTDRGVLYVGSNAGVAWNGLTGVSESPTGGDPQPFYLDGVRFLNVSALEEFAATINAFSAPIEFGVCDGTRQIAAGLFIGQQPRTPFNFSYRTLIGNDIDGSDHGYKIHLVYNASASPSAKSNASNSDTVTPITFSWAVQTVPIRILNQQPSAHLIVDSTLTNPTKLAALETILYGNPGVDPRMPQPSEMVTLLT